MANTAKNRGHGDQSMDNDRQMDTSRGSQSSQQDGTSMGSSSGSSAGSRNAGNFANDPQRASELGSKGGRSRDR